MTVTIKEVHAIITRMDAVQELSAFHDREALAEKLGAINEQLGTWCGEGEVREELRETSYAIGPDYICALEDGSILAWGRDRVIGRELYIIDAPEKAS